MKKEKKGPEERDRKAKELPKKEGKPRAAPVVVLPPLGSSSRTPKSKKRKASEDSIELAPTPDHDLIHYKPRPLPARLPIAALPSPSQSSIHLESLNTSPAFSSRSLEPPQSVIGTSSSGASSVLSHSSLSLEVAILRSQLAAARENLQRERDRSRQERERYVQELQALEEQFALERKQYRDFINSLENRS